MPVAKNDGHESPIFKQKMDKGHPAAETALIKSGGPRLPETAWGFNRPPGAIAAVPELNQPYSTAAAIVVYGRP
jgi:hypothetical protein